MAPVAYQTAFELWQDLTRELLCLLASLMKVFYYSFIRFSNRSEYEIDFKVT